MRGVYIVFLVYVRWSFIRELQLHSSRYIMHVDEGHTLYSSIGYCISVCLLCTENILLQVRRAFFVSAAQCKS